MPLPDSARVHRLIVPASAAGRRLDQALAELLHQHSRTRLKGWIESGLVRIDGAVVESPRHRLYGGEALVVTEDRPTDEGNVAPQAIALTVLFEDATLLVIDKPAGLVVHPGSGNRDGTLQNAILHHAPANAALPRAGIVHRLDKDTSGLLVVAKTIEAQTSLVRQLQARTVKRDYRAIVHGLVARDGTVEAPIGRDPAVRTRMAVVASGRPARTHYRVIERAREAEATLLECSLDTGRTHQIRVHLRSIGHPIVGDPVYGRRPARPGALAAFGRQALHAMRLALDHPVSGERLQWTYPMPEDMRALWLALGGEKGA